MFADLPVTPDDVALAAERIRPYAARTPLLASAHLDALTGARVFLKPECLQHTGSFKFRGAVNAVASLTPGQRAAGVLAWSSGNHAQAVAAAGRLMDAPATLVMPADAPRLKYEATAALGARIVPYDRYTQDREAIGRTLAAEQGLTIIPPYDYAPTIAGQGTVGREIAEDLQELGTAPDMLLCCCGGGGLIAGTALAVKAVFPNTEVFAVEPEGFDDTYRSLAAGTRLHNAPDARSICDALLAPEPGEVTFAINRCLLSGGFVVSDTQALEAMAYAFTRLKLVLEPGGAVALAALLNHAYHMRGKTVAVILSGGNVDADQFRKALTPHT